MYFEPSPKRAVAFVDGQNLFRCAKTAFGYDFPNYDIYALASSICNQNGWQLMQVCFYTGIPEKTEDLHKNPFWNAKLNAMKLSGIITFYRYLHYQIKEFDCPGIGTQKFRVGVEKGIDIRIAIDVIRMAYHQDYDVALIFSQDQDFSEVAKEIRNISTIQNRWIKITSAFPDSPSVRNNRGINNTDWIRIDKTTYDACIDPRDYRPSTTQSI